MGIPAGRHPPHFTALLRFGSYFVRHFQNTFMTIYVRNGCYKIYIYDLIVSPNDMDGVIDIINKHGYEAWQVGHVNDNGRIIVNYNRKNIVLE